MLRDAPASCARDLGHQMADVESFEEASYGRTGAPLLGRLQRCAEQGLPDVAVAKAPRDVVAIQHYHEQPHVFAPCGIETSVTAPLDDLGLGKLPEFLVGGRRIVHDE